MRIPYACRAKSHPSGLENPVDTTTSDTFMALSTGSRLISMTFNRLIQCGTQFVTLAVSLVFSAMVHGQSALPDCTQPLPVPVLGDFRMVGN